MTLPGFLGLSKANCQACLARLCQSQLGQMINSGLTPVSALAGGLIPPLCPPAPALSPAALAALPGGPNGAAATAAKIKANEAGAAARVAAVEYLGTVDCARWPNARDALIAALRGDENECVRFAAARALGSGCCCSTETIAALKASVSGEKDKDPAELSPRVRGAAFAALQNCLARVPAVITAPPPVRVEPEGPRVAPEGPSTSAHPADATHLAASHSATIPEPRTAPEKSTAQIIDEARQTLINASQNPPRLRMLPTGKRSVFHALAKARLENSVPAGPIPPPPTAPMPDPNRDASPAQPPMPDPNLSPSPGVVPTSFVVPSGPDGVSPAIAPAAQPDAASKPAATAKRGLAGILFKSWNRGDGQ
jgi:hypothetical protein